MMRESAGVKIEKPIETIKNVTKKYNLSDKDGEIILSNMGTNGDFTKYGLANGVTFLAHEIDNYDKAYELEKIGGEIISASNSEWMQLVA